MAVQTSREPIRPVTGTHVFRIQHEGIATADAERSKDLELVEASSGGQQARAVGSGGRRGGRGCRERHREGVGHVAPSSAGVHSEGNAHGGVACAPRGAVQRYRIAGLPAARHAVRARADEKSVPVRRRSR